VARRAGKNPAARAPSVNRNATPINVSGSNGVTPKSSVDKERVENRAADASRQSEEGQLRRLRKHKAAKARSRRCQRHAHASPQAECPASVTDQVFNLVLTAIGGCQVQSGLLQSMPSSSIDS
jgi:hypothetical protein